MCLIELSGEPTPDVTWFRDGIQLKPSKGEPRLKIHWDVSQDLFVLVITDARPDDSGNYTLVVSNSNGETSYQVLVKVSQREAPHKTLGEEPTDKEVVTKETTVKVTGVSQDETLIEEVVLTSDVSVVKVKEVVTEEEQKPTDLIPKVDLDKTPEIGQVVLEPETTVPKEPAIMDTEKQKELIPSEGLPDQEAPVGKPGDEDMPRAPAEDKPVNDQRAPREPSELTIEHTEPIKPDTKDETTAPQEPEKPETAKPKEQTTITKEEPQKEETDIDRPQEIPTGVPIKPEEAVEVAKPKEPMAPQDLCIIEAYPDGIIITWEAPQSDGGSPVTHYVVVIKDAASGKKFRKAGRVDSSVRSFKITEKIKEEHEYLIMVYAENDLGVSSEGASLPGPVRVIKKRLKLEGEASDVLKVTAKYTEPDSEKTSEALPEEKDTEPAKEGLKPKEAPKPIETITLEKEPISEAPVKTKEPVSPLETKEPVSKVPEKVTEPIAEPPIQAKEPVTEVPLETKEPVSKVPEKVTEPIAEPPIQAKEPVTEVPLETKEPVSKVPEKVTEPTAEAPIQAKEPVAEVPLEAKEPVSKVPEKVTEPIAEAPVKAKEPVAEVPLEAKEPVSKVAEKVTEPISEAPVKAKEPVAEVPLEAKEPVSKVPEKVTEPIAEPPIQAKEPVTEVPLETKEPVSKVAEKVTEPISEAPVKAKEPVAEVPREAKEPVSEVPAKISEPILEAPSKVKEPTSEVPDKVKEAVSDARPDKYESGDEGSSEESAEEGDVKKSKKLKRTRKQHESAKESLKLKERARKPWDTDTSEESSKEESPEREIVPVKETLLPGPSPKKDVSFESYSSSSEEEEEEERKPKPDMKPGEHVTTKPTAEEASAPKGTPEFRVKPQGVVVAMGDDIRLTCSVEGKMDINLSAWRRYLTFASGCP